MFVNYFCLILSKLEIITLLLLDDQMIIVNVKKYIDFFLKLGFEPSEQY